MNQDETISLITIEPNGNVVYSAAEARGPLALAIAAGISLCSVIVIAIAITVNGLKTNFKFVKSQVGAYFLSLIFCDLLQAIGSIMNARWVAIQGVESGPFCTAQGALKQTGNVGSAIWSLAIAVHTFYLLFLQKTVSRKAFYSVLVFTWLLIGFIVMMGPVILRNASKGPFYGPSGFWCWIRDEYRTPQLTNEYLFMFITAFSSFILYSLLFLKLRGNIQSYEWKIRFTWKRIPLRVDIDEQISDMGRQMLWYPVAYTLIVLPIAVCRWMEQYHHTVPYGATMTADTIFVLSGFVNSILYSTTRKIVSIRTLLPFSKLIRRLSSTSSTDTLSGNRNGGVGINRFPPPQFKTQLITPTPVFSPHSYMPSRNGSEVPDYVRANFLNMRRTPSPGGSSEVDFKMDYGVSLPHVQNRHPYAMAQTNRPQISITPPHGRSERTTEDDVGKTEPHSPSTDDGAPSVHRKRFSGWGMPPLQDARIVGEQPVARGHHDPHLLRTASDDSVMHSSSLEEMRFATPSPETIRNRGQSPNNDGTPTTKMTRPPNFDYYRR